MRLLTFSGRTAKEILRAPLNLGFGLGFPIILLLLLSACLLYTSIVATKGMDGLVIATIMAGLLLIRMGVLKLGVRIRFIPYTITTGFTAGIAVTILIGQLKDFFGLTFQGAPVETMEMCIRDSG